VANFHLPPEKALVYLQQFGNWEAVIQ